MRHCPKRTHSPRSGDRPGDDPVVKRREQRHNLDEFPRIAASCRMDPRVGSSLPSRNAVARCKLQRRQMQGPNLPSGFTAGTSAFSSDNGDYADVDRQYVRGVFMLKVTGTGDLCSNLNSTRLAAWL